MFNRVTFEDWQAVITIIAFFCCFLTFAWFTWRALRMKKSERDRMANLPLEKENSKEKKNDNE